MKFKIGDRVKLARNGYGTLPQISKTGEIRKVVYDGFYNTVYEIHLDDGLLRVRAFETELDPVEASAPEQVEQAAKILKEYCHSIMNCENCAFYKNGTSTCMKAPCLWEVSK